VAVEIYVASANAAFLGWQPPMNVDEVLVSRWTQDLVKPGYRWSIADVDGCAVGLAAIGTGGARS